ncbi:unnamed protein product [Euphydryas editha]|uniref:Uncharacterized protein n=1 Tax=Euphydryas editha TaxID=104508 RepID=A0AAU9USN7_EUPED|nr:unnamed protein product [Euphydryas editha]
MSSKIFRKRNESDSEESDKEVLRGEASFASDNDEEKDALTLSTKKILEENDKQDSHQFESKNEKKSATSFLRRLMDGVFKPDVILNLNCTYSGRPPSAQGKDKQLKKVEPLDRQAKRALIEYYDDYATKNGWPKSNQSDLRVAICRNGSVS